MFPYEFDLCASIFLLVIFILTCVFNTFPSVSNKKFKQFVLVALISFLSSVFLSFTIKKLPAEQYMCLNLINTFRLIFINSISIVYYRFVLAMVYDTRPIKIKHVIFLYVLLAFVVLSIGTSSVTHFIFFFNPDGSYYRGPGMNCLYVIQITVLIVATFELIGHRKELTPRQISLICSFEVLLIAALIFQALNPSYAVTGMAVSIALFVNTYTLRNPSELIHSNTGMYNRLAFREFIFNLRTNKYKSLCLVRIKNFDAIAQNYGNNSSYHILQKSIEDLQAQTGIRYVFYIVHNCFVFFTKDKQEAYNYLKKVKEYSTKPIEEEHADCISEHLHIHFENDFFYLEDINVLKHGNKRFAETADEDITNLLNYAVESLIPENGICRIDSKAIEEFEASAQRKKILKEAIKNETLEVYLQPIYDLKTKTFTGAESLIRLRDPNGKFISPALFIPDAEKDGSIVQLGEISLKKTCQFIKDANLYENGITKVNVNLSMIQCMQNNIVQNLVSIMDSYNIPKEMIRFEITETMMTTSPERLDKVMKELNDYGIEFALDDYGTGYSNTSRLLQFPFKEIKFDRSFVVSILEDDKNSIPLKYLMGMVKNSGMIALVEGVEEKETSDLIEEFGGDLIQGYYYAKPMPIEDFKNFLKEKVSKA